MKELKKEIKRPYKNFMNKEVSNMVGLDINFDKPKNLSLHLKWKKNLTALKLAKKL